MLATRSGHVHRTSFSDLLDSERVVPAQPRRNFANGDGMRRRTQAPGAWVSKSWRSSLRCGFPLVGVRTQGNRRANRRPSERRKARVHAATRHRARNSSQEVRGNGPASRLARPAGRSITQAAIQISSKLPRGPKTAALSVSPVPGAMLTVAAQQLPDRHRPAWNSSLPLFVLVRSLRPPGAARRPVTSLRGCAHRELKKKTSTKSSRIGKGEES